MKKNLIFLLLLFLVACSSTTNNINCNELYKLTSYSANATVCEQDPKLSCKNLKYLADVYRYGKGVKYDNQKAIQYYSQVTEQCHDYSGYLAIASMYENNEEPVDFETKLNFYQKMHQEEILQGSIILSEIYEYGINVPQNTDQALKILEEAGIIKINNSSISLIRYRTSDDNLVSRINLLLGKILALDNYKYQDADQGYKYLHKAAKFKLPYASYYLGEFFANKKSLNDAYLWYSIADCNRVSEAKNKVAKYSTSESAIRANINKHLLKFCISDYYPSYIVK